MIEYSSKNDCFAEFKPVFDNRGKFLDYVFINSANGFESILGFKKELLIGKRMSEILLQCDEEFFNLREIYYNMIPKTRKKFEKYIPSLKRWYFIIIFSDERDYLFVFFNDITPIRGEAQENSEIHIEIVADNI